MSDNANTVTVRKFIEDVWNENRLGTLDTSLDSDYHDYTYEPRNREGLERALLLMQTAFPGHETIIDEIVGEGDTVGVCFTLRGSQTGPFRGLPASGKSFEIGGYRFYKIRDGKIISHRGLLDIPSLLQQISASE